MPTYDYQGKSTQVFQKLPGYKKLAAWQAASDLGHLIARIVQGFRPSHYRLADQMRGAAISIGGNIAEGYCSGSLPNYIRYCNHARGSLAELGSYLQDCERESILTGDQLNAVVRQYGDAGFYLDRLLQALIKKEDSGTWDNRYWVKEDQPEYTTDVGIDSEAGANFEPAAQPPDV